MLDPVRDDIPADSADPTEVESEPPARLPASYGLLPGGLSLRLTLRARPLALLRRLLLAITCAGTGFLLLAALGHAAGHPAHTTNALVRLAWCAVPLAAVTQLAVSVFRLETRAAVTPALAAVGLGPARLPLLAAAQAVVTCVVGSAVALVSFLAFRDRLTGIAPLPAAGTATLLAVVPLAVALACLIALRPRGTRSHNVAGPVWGVASVAAGLAAEIYAAGPTHPSHHMLPLPGGLGSIAPVALAGWVLVVTGPALAGPGLIHLTGRVLSTYHPGALRLLAGRALQADASRIGRPLGLLSATVCAAASAAALRDPGARPLGALTVLAAAVVLLCAVVALACAVAHAMRARTDTAVVLSTLGAARGLLRSSAVLRTVILVALFAPVIVVLAWLAVPLPG